MQVQGVVAGVALTALIGSLMILEFYFDVLRLSLSTVAAVYGIARTMREKIHATDLEQGR